MPNNKTRKFQNIAITIMFLLFLILPSLGLVFGIAPVTLAENRARATFPIVTSEWTELQAKPFALSGWLGLARYLFKFPGGFQKYFNDNFGFRDFLIRTHSYLALQGFPSHSDAVIGKDGWLFYTETRALSSYSMNDPFSPEELENWRIELESRRDWLAERGIQYLFVIAPEKSTIYPEFMPDNIPREGHTSRIDQLVSYMEQHSDVQVVEPLTDLLNGKKNDIQYLRTDTHWNDLGAYTGYRTIVRRLSIWFPQLVPEPASKFKFEMQSYSGDLAGILALNGILVEDAPFMIPSASMLSHPADPGIGAFPGTTATEVDDPSLPKAVVFRDSFGDRLAPFLSENFSRALFVLDDGLVQATILKEQPNIVIQEMAERKLQYPKTPGTVR